MGKKTRYEVQGREPDAAIPKVDRATMPIAQLKPAPYNAAVRRITDRSRGGLRASIHRWGLLQDIVWNRATGNVVGGHERLGVLEAAGETEAQVTIVEIPDLEEEKALSVALNSPAIAGEFTEDLQGLLATLEADLPDLFAALNLDDRKIEAEGGTAGLTDPDDVPEPPKVPITKPGDLWILGDHRLLAGDSTKAEDVARVMGGAVPDLLFFDPPYEVESAWALTVLPQKALVFTDYKHIREAMGIVLSYPVTYHFVWDTVISWYTSNRPLCRHRSAFYCAQVHGWDADAATYVDGNQRDETVKHSGAFPGSYIYKPLSGGRVRVTTVYQQTKTVDESGNGKPVAWVRALLAGAQARVVYEPFAGTGATIIAAPEGCTVHAVEIDPAKVDVAVERWETVTGGKAVRQ